MCTVCCNHCLLTWCGQILGKMIGWKILFIADYGIRLTNRVHPICLPYSSNSNKRKDREVTVLGFATTSDISGSTSTTLKAAEMLVFSTDECNNNLQEELTKSKECKLLSQNFKNLVHKHNCVISI